MVQGLVFNTIYVVQIEINGCFKVAKFNSDIVNRPYMYLTS